MNSIPAPLTAEEIYEALANIVTNDINDEWKTATIHAVVNDDEDVTFQGIYTTAHRNIPEEQASVPLADVHDSQDDGSSNSGGSDNGSSDNGSLDNEGSENGSSSSREPNRATDDDSGCEETVNYFCTQSAVYDLILDLRRILHQAGTEPFNEVDFTLSRDGDYDLYFSYSDNA